MSNSKKLAWHYRPLLTDTLPYELPVIFGNEALHYARSQASAPNLAEVLFRQVGKFTIPYNFHIRKDSTRHTVLSLVHPATQLEFCDFYAQHENSILAQCKRGRFSLRYPKAVAAVYSPEVGAANTVHKAGRPELAQPVGIELSKLVSYFSYEKYTLLNKFYDSKEFIRLEKRFSKLRQIDISKCFYGIYTHSISWATRSKSFAKVNVGVHYFEAAFDGLMQRANYNETNGIVVGPEFSRIFAEIILQGIDVAVHRKLKEAHNLVEGRDYSIRRYVDDYSIFSHLNEYLDLIQNEIHGELLKYKLHINESKVRSYQRPFISPITHARFEMRSAVMVARTTLSSDRWKQGNKLTPTEREGFKALLNEIRSIAHRYNVELAYISGILSADLRHLVRLANRKDPLASADWDENWQFAIEQILECAFYVTAVDLRVRTTYSLCQLLNSIKEAVAVSERNKYRILRTTSQELAALCQIAHQESRHHPRGDSIELFNILICAAHTLGADFLKLREIDGILKDILSGETTYFKYICLKYCLLRDEPHFRSMLDDLNLKVENIGFSQSSVSQNSEHFHLFCDLLSAPDISPARKLSIFVRVFGGRPSTADVDELAKSVGFVDWSGLSIEHTLRRRQLRPVYAVA